MTAASSRSASFNTAVGSGCGCRIKPPATGSEHNRQFGRRRVRPSRRPGRGRRRTDSTSEEIAALLLAHKKTHPTGVCRRQRRGPAGRLPVRDENQRAGRAGRAPGPDRVLHGGAGVGAGRDSEWDRCRAFSHSPPVRCSIYRTATATFDTLRCHFRGGRAQPRDLLHATAGPVPLVGSGFSRLHGRGDGQTGCLGVGAATGTPTRMRSVG